MGDSAFQVERANWLCFEVPIAQLLEHSSDLSCQDNQKDKNDSTLVNLIETAHGSSPQTGVPDSG
jgi:hypothetical protein